uniref:BTB domain-containing protein n=1 Tax=Panagrolaimus sp. ES5 TaxID=591445 RepID=A0AC34FFQ8_9BILA
MSLYFADRVKEQKADDRTSETNIVFTFPWILNIPLQRPNDEEYEEMEQTFFSTSYKMTSSPWNVSFVQHYNRNYISLYNIDRDRWTGIFYISYTLYYDAEMRFEYFSSTKIQMEKIFLQDGIDYHTPDGSMAKFIESMYNNRFSKCVIFIELHLPTKQFYQPSFKRERIKNEIFDEFSDDFENNFGLEFMKNGDYTFECLDGIVRAQRVVLFSTSETMKRQLRPPCHYPVGIVKYTVDVVKTIMILFHSHVLKLPESYDLEYIDRLLHAFDFFEHPNPKRKCEMITKVHESLCQKFAKARNMHNPLYRQLFEQASTVRNADNHQNGRSLVDEIFKCIEEIFKDSFFTNVILQ